MTSNLLSPAPKPKNSDSFDGVMSGDIHLRRAAILQDLPQKVRTASLAQLEKYMLPQQRFNDAELDKIYQSVAEHGFYSIEKSHWPDIARGPTELRRYKRFAEIQQFIVDVAYSITGKETSLELSFESDGNKYVSTPEGRKKEGRHDGAIIHKGRARMFRKHDNMNDVRSVLLTEEFKPELTDEKELDVSPRNPSRYTSVFTISIIELLEGARNYGDDNGERHLPPIRICLDYGRQQCSDLVA
jgi:hypothetical protein